MKRIIWFCLIFTCTLALPAQTSVALVFNDQDIETGDTFSVRVLVSGTNARPDRVNFSAWRDFLPPENILRSSAWTRSGNNWVSEHKLIVFDAVVTIMPPFSVYLLAGEPVFSNPIKWKVRATATNGELYDMAPQRDIRREALQWTDFAL